MKIIRAIDVHSWQICQVTVFKFNNKEGVGTPILTPFDECIKVFG